MQLEISRKETENKTAEGLWAADLNSFMKQVMKCNYWLLSWHASSGKENALTLKYWARRAEAVNTMQGHLFSQQP